VSESCFLSSNYHMFHPGSKIIVNEHRKSQIVIGKTSDLLENSDISARSRSNPPASCKKIEKPKLHSSMSKLETNNSKKSSSEDESKNDSEAPTTKKGDDPSPKSIKKEKEKENESSGPAKKTSSLENLIRGWDSSSLAANSVSSIIVNGASKTLEKTKSSPTIPRPTIAGTIIARAGCSTGSMPKIDFDESEYRKHLSSKTVVQLKDITVDLKRNVLIKEQMLDERDEIIKAQDALIRQLTSEVQKARGLDKKDELFRKKKAAADLPKPDEPLIELVRKGDLVQVIAKLQHGDEDVNQPNESGRCALHVATSLDDRKTKIQMVKYLLSMSADPNFTDQAGWTPMHNATSCPPVVKLLLDAGGDPKAVNIKGTGVLHYFVRQDIKGAKQIEEFIDVFQILVDRGADINAITDAGDSVAHTSITYGHESLAMVLLEQDKLDVGVKNREGETLLHAAVVARKKPVVEVLMDKYSMDPRELDGRGASALTLARRQGAIGKEIYDLVRARASALDMENMSKEEKNVYRRALAIEEIVVTEKMYNDDLHILIRNYLQPIREKNLLTERQIDIIFGNVEELKEVSTAFHAELVEVTKDILDDSSPVLKTKMPYIGQVFLNHSDRLRAYEYICINQERSTDALDEALGKNQKKEGLFKNKDNEFKKFCDRTKKLPACRKLDISSFLSAPFRRVTKYPLLIREVLNKITEDDPDHKPLTKASEALGVMISTANEKKREYELIKASRSIVQNIVWENDSILDSGLMDMPDYRVHTKDEKLSVSVNDDDTKERHVFLFTDTIIVTEISDKKDRYIFICAIPLGCDDIAVQGLPNVVVRNGYKIEVPSKNVRVIFSHPDGVAKQNWMQLINNNIKEFKNSEFFETSSNKLLVSPAYEALLGVTGNGKEKKKRTHTTASEVVGRARKGTELKFKRSWKKKNKAKDLLKEEKKEHQRRKSADISDPTDKQLQSTSDLFVANQKKKKRSSMIYKRNILS